MVQPAVNGKAAGSNPAGTASLTIVRCPWSKAESCDWVQWTIDNGPWTNKNVLLGEQSVSNADAVGSNPTVLAVWSTRSASGHRLARRAGNNSLVEQPGVLAALTWRRSLVQIQPGLRLLPWPSGNGVPLTRGRTQVRVLPGVLCSQLAPRVDHELRSGLERFPARSHKPFDAGSNPASAIRSGEWLVVRGQKRAGEPQRC